jgi:hypothetical protein
MKYATRLVISGDKKVTITQWQLIATVAPHPNHCCVRKCSVDDCCNHWCGPCGVPIWNCQRHQYPIQTDLDGAHITLLRAAM